VKGISMSVFTEEDVAYLASVGNEAHNAKYLSKINKKDFSFPNGNDVVKLKEFIKQKYFDKKWYQSNENNFATSTTTITNNNNNNNNNDLDKKPVANTTASISNHNSFVIKPSLQTSKLVVLY
jgi:hypothetical protein